MFNLYIFDCKNTSFSFKNVAAFQNISLLFWGVTLWPKSPPQRRAIRLYFVPPAIAHPAFGFKNEFANLKESLRKGLQRLHHFCIVAYSEEPDPAAFCSGSWDTPN